MAKIIRREIRKRGVFGWLFLLVFWGFNALMALWTYAYWSKLAENDALSEAARVGKTLGGTIGTGFIAFFWLAGAVIFGVFALLSRGKKVTIEETVEA